MKSVLTALFITLTPMLSIAEGQYDDMYDYQCDRSHGAGYIRLHIAKLDAEQSACKLEILNKQYVVEGTHYGNIDRDRTALLLNDGFTAILFKFDPATKRTRAVRRLNDGTEFQIGDNCGNSDFGG